VRPRGLALHEIHDLARRSGRRLREQVEEHAAGALILRSERHGTAGLFERERAIGERSIGHAGPSERVLRAPEMELGEPSAQLHVTIAAEVGLDEVGEHARGGEAMLAIASACEHARRLELGRNVAGRRPLRGARLCALAGPRDDLVEATLAVERLPREELEQDRAERIDVGALVGRVSLEDLGRRIGRRADDVSHRSLVRAAARRAASLLLDQLVVGELREAPVEDVGLAVGAQHHVRGLDVAMEDAALVGVADREAHLHEGREQAVAPVGAHHRGVARSVALDDLGERDAANALHREEGAAVAIDAEVVHGDDRRMLEPRLDAGLAHEAGAHLGVRRIVGVHGLHRHLAADRAVLAERDLPHAALAERGEELVALRERHRDRVGVLEVARAEERRRLRDVVVACHSNTSSPVGSTRRRFGESHGTRSKSSS